MAPATRAASPRTESNGLDTEDGRHGCGSEGRPHAREVELKVANPLSKAAAANHSGNRIALENIRERLELAWPGRARVEVAETENEYVVTLAFPLTGSEAVA